MKTNIKMIIILIVGVIAINSAKADVYYGKTIVITEENTSILADSLIIKRGTAPDYIDTIPNIRVKNGIEFFIQLPENHNVFNLSSVGKLEKDKIRVLKAGSLHFNFYLNGKRFHVLADVNYFGVLQYEGADAPAVIEVTKENEDKELYMPKHVENPAPDGKMDIFWKILLMNQNDSVPLQDYDSPNIYRITLKELIKKIKNAPEYNGSPDVSEWNVKLSFSDRTSNGYYGETEQIITIKDKRGAQEYNITVNPTPNGKVTASLGKAKAGTQVTLSAQADAGYRLKEGTLKAQTSGGNTLALSANSFTMPSSDVVISAEFEPIPVRQIIISTVGQGSITATPQSGIVGTRIKLSIAPAEGYRFLASSLRVMGANNTPVAVTNNEFVMPDMDVFVLGEFEQIPLYDVLISPTVSHGSITATPSKALAGTLITLTITPDEGYRLKENSLKVQAVGSNQSGGNGEDDVITESIVLNPDNNFVLPNYTVMVVAEFEPKSSGVSLIEGEKISETNGKVSLYLSENAEISLYSLSGTLLLQESATAGQEQRIALPATQGVYLLSVTTPTRNFSWKVKK